MRYVMLFGMLLVFAIAVRAADAALPTLTMNMTLAPGAQFAVNFTAPVGCTETAWIGIIPADVPHGNELESDRHKLTFHYLHGKAAGTLLFTAPTAPGAYDLRLFASDDGGKELSSSTFLVVAHAVASVGGAGKAFQLKASTDAGVLTGTYPRTNLRMRMTVTFTGPGAIFDNIGILAAPVGSFVVSVSDNGICNLHVYDPERQTPYKVANGWHVLKSATALTKGVAGEVVIDILPTAMTIRVNNGAVAHMALPTPLSGKTVYVGNFPGDDDWDSKYNIHAGMIGTVIVSQFGALDGALPAPAVNATFAGEWTTDFNDMTLSIEGNRVTGTYAHKGGEISGTLSADGRTIMGTWTQTPSRKAPYDMGRFIFTLADDGQSFTGKWGYADAAPTDRWEGKRQAGGVAPTPTPVPPPAPPALFTGSWETDFGMVTLKVEGNRIIGSYPHDQGRIEGMVSADGRTATGHWSEAPDYQPPDNAGRFVWKLSADGKTFTGKWSYGDKEPAATWNGTKK